MPDVLTSTLQGFNTPEMAIYYDKFFLEVAEETPRYDVLCIKKTIPANSGKTVQWTRQVPRATFITPLTEGVTPDSVSTSSENVSATIDEYGTWEKISSKFSLTTLDANLKERVQRFGQQAGETIDDLIKAELVAGATVQIAGGKSHISALAASDQLSTVELRKSVKTLRREKAPRFEEGFYKGVFSIQGCFDLLGEDRSGSFMAVNVYKTPEQIKKNELGRLAGIIIHEADNESTEASTTTVYHNFVAGKGAVAIADISGKGNAKITVKTPDAHDTSNPLDMFSTISAKIEAIAVKTLQPKWLINIKTGS